MDSTDTANIDNDKQTPFFTDTLHEWKMFKTGVSL
jgi:hypothetical protein